MENYQLPASPTGSATLKDSTRDMAQLQREHKLPDELFWEIFNARVLLNQPIDVNAFVRSRYPD